MNDSVDPLLNRPHVLNPYKIALKLLIKRLLWDVRYQSWASRTNLKKIRSQYSGKAVILCNGPSLNKVDFLELSESDAFVFGLNKINLLFNKTPFRPDAIVCVNKLVIEQNAEFFNSTDIPLFLDSSALQHVSARKGLVYLHAADVRGHFSRDCSISVFQGNTVTYVAMQLAYHMGFNDVALVGCDHYFANKGPANKTVVSGASDSDHFDPSYFSGGVSWQLPDLFESEISYQLAKRYYEADGRNIVNCTAGGNLEVLPRKSLNEFLAG